METTLPMDRRPPGSVAQGQALPSITTLTSGLSQPQSDKSPSHIHQHFNSRDSGNWSAFQSKHSSGVSNTAGFQIQKILNADDSPTRTSAYDVSQSARISGQQSALPSLNQGFESHRPSLDTSSYHLDSRRSSVDSRMNQGMNHLAISPSSPYESQNVSRVSLTTSLQQQRGIPTEQRPNGPAPMSPLGARTAIRAHQAPRRAPVINPNPRSVSGMPDPTAAAPTKGFAWAFPDSVEAERRESSSDESSIGPSIPSRQNSYAASVNSSIYTTDSMLPPGQRRFEDEIPHTHHHSLQHRTVASLQGAEPTATTGTGNYSRTPELRISHKMAERKRRCEMKQLFDELNGILPNSPGAKSSKWEILTKSIEHIRALRRTESTMMRENDRLHADADYARRTQEENKLLRTELEVMWHRLRQVEPNNPHVYGNFSNLLAHEQAQTPSSVPATMLPPLQAPPPPTQWAPPPPPSAPMQGVEYATSAQAYQHR